MKTGELGFGLTFALLPISPFFLTKSLDLWHASGLWMQVAAIVLFAQALFRPRFTLIGNVPLSLWLGWTGLSTLYLWTQMLVKYQGYALTMLLPIMHIVILLLLYIAATTTWDSGMIFNLSKYIAIGGCVLLAYCTLQVLGLDQFFNDTYMSRNFKPVGTIGNTSHLAAQLTMLLPIFLMQRNRWFSLAAIWATALIVLTKSITGIAVSFMILVLWSLLVSYLLSGALLAFGLIVGGICAASIPQFLSLGGRMEVWAELRRVLSLKPITGHGLGYVYELSKTIEPGQIGYHWRHAHNEYLQLWLEQGIIGLGLLLWLIIHPIKLALTNLERHMVYPLLLILISFLLLCVTGYPLHLWQLGILPFFAYCGLLVLLEKA